MFRSTWLIAWMMFRLFCYKNPQPTQQPLVFGCRITLITNLIIDHTDGSASLICNKSPQQADFCQAKVAVDKLLM